MIRNLAVLLGEYPVGRLEQSDNGIELRFREEYWEDPDHPVLGQAFEDRPGRNYREHSGRLPRFFAHLLPEGVLAEILQKQYKLDAGDAVGLLRIVGRDLPGAVIVRDEEDETAVLLRGAYEAEAPSSEQGESGLRFSLAGVQLKLSVAQAHDRLTVSVNGTRIAKLPAPAFPGLSENEWSMMKWAAEVGLPVPAFELKDANLIEGVPKAYRQTTAFVIDRYDRELGQRVHQEDFAQVQNLAVHEKYDGSYETLGRLIRGIVRDAGHGFLRRLAFVVGTGNGDAHWKNWSLLYADGRTASLAPVYDQVATVAWPEVDRALALTFGSARGFGEITTNALHTFARKCGFGADDTEQVFRDTFDAMATVWRQDHENWPLPGSHVSAIREHWSRTPLLREFGALA